MLTPQEIELGEKKSESDLTDVEILEQDLIKCLFRMNLLKRIVYLLDRMRLSPSIIVVNSVKNSFHILIRMARHSLSCANQVELSRYVRLPRRNSLINFRFLKKDN